MTGSHDPLWTPGASGDPGLEHIERLLRVYRHREPEPLPHWPQPAHRPARRMRVFALAAAAVLGVLLCGAAWLGWRLSWNHGDAWPLVVSTPDADASLRVGARLETAAGETARLAVARIGAVTLSPDSRLRLLDTRPGRHRIALESGHLRARIWAPPGWFAVRIDGAMIIDFGCEFELWTQADGRGRIEVTSGWIMHASATRDTLVPAGHVLRFERGRVGLPLRADATSDFATSVDRLDAALAGDGNDPVAAQTEVAARADKADAFTLLSLLTRHPRLAAGPLYPRLAGMLGVDADDTAHRAAWMAGEREAIDAWWQRIPRPPKQWWRYWRDAFA